MLLLLLHATAVSAALGANGLGKIYAAGSGQNMLSLPETIEEIIAFSGKSKPNVLYLGTATYDDPAPQKTQTQSFLDRGCSVSSLAIAVKSPSVEEMRPAFMEADVVIVSGGNTLFASDRWMKLGIDGLMREAMANGAVLSGGSAGMIIWFDGGHSDSMEPDSYKNPPGPLLNPIILKNETAKWAYIRVPGIGILPGLACPHYDMVGSNGVHRAVDFTGTMQHHSGENAIGVDNWAALVIDGDSYHVVSRKGKAGSVGEGGQFSANRTGVPGMWKLQISAKDGSLQRTVAPMQGKVADILPPPRYISPSKLVPVAREQNPDDGVPPAWTGGVGSDYVISNPEWWW